MSLCLITPIKDQMMGPTHASVVAFATAYVQSGKRFEHKTSWLCSDLPHARALLLSEALKTDPDHILFIDDDMTFSPQNVFDLLSANVDAVSCVYRKKTPVKEHVGTPLPQGETQGPLIEMERIGLGVALFKTKSLRKCLESQGDKPFQPYPGFDDAESFSLRYRESGSRIWLHTGVKCGHIGFLEYR